MNQKFFENLAKPCQTAGWPEQVSPFDEAARTAPWRRSPDLSCRYSYRHRVSIAPAPANPKQRNKPILPELAWNHRFQSRPRPLAHLANLEKRSKPNSGSRFNRSTVQPRYPERTQFRPNHLESRPCRRVPAPASACSERNTKQTQSRPPLRLNRSTPHSATKNAATNPSSPKLLGIRALQENPYSSLRSTGEYTKRTQSRQGLWHPRPGGQARVLVITGGQACLPRARHAVRRPPGRWACCAKV